MLYNNTQAFDKELQDLTEYCQLIQTLRFTACSSEADVNKLKNILQGTEVFLICQSKIACCFSRTINNYNNVKRISR
jgi:hypothetical protein